MAMFLLFVALLFYAMFALRGCDAQSPDKVDINVFPTATP
jgi:hypothetical protein